MDGIAPVEQVTRPAFEAVTSPSLLWVITGAGHNAFDDFCTFGNGQGIIGVGVIDENWESLSDLHSLHTPRYAIK